MKLFNLKIFLSRAKQKKKYIFYITILILLFISFFVLNYIVSFLKANEEG